MNIGFDLDKVFINFPPFIPPKFIRIMYGEKSNGQLTYRIPGKIEQKIRQLSHIPFLRQPMRENMQIVKTMSTRHNWNFFLISSRYGFLRHATETLVQKYGLTKYFKKLYFNFSNQQPHLFKSLAITKEHIDAYIDDDLPLLIYLAKQHPHVHFFWLNEKTMGKIQKNIEAITNFSDFFKKL